MSLVTRFFLQLIFSFSCIIAPIASLFASSVSVHEITIPTVWVKQLNQLYPTGVLRMKPNGYVYLKLPDSFLHYTQPFLQAMLPHLSPKCYPLETDKIGAHISVYYKIEPNAERKIRHLLGTRFNISFRNKLFIVREHKRGHSVIFYGIRANLEKMAYFSKLQTSQDLSSQLHATISEYNSKYDSGCRLVSE